MANTVSILSYANTFGEWVVNTNTLAKENNDFAANNFTKPTGTLFLNDPSLGLQIANNAIFGGQLQVTGIGSTGYIQNNLRVDGQVYFTNTTIGLVNSGQANIAGALFATGSNTGLNVANNTYMGGTLNVIKSVNFANNLIVSGPTLLANTANITGAVNVDNFLTVTANAVVEGAVYTDYLIANNRINTPRAVVSAYIDASQARVDADLLYANTSTISTAYLNVIQSNTSINTAFVNANSAYAQTLTTTRLNLNGTFVGNTSTIFANNIQTFGQLSVGGNFVINGQTVYNANTFTLNSGSSTAQQSSVLINRGTDGSNAEFRWNEESSYWDIKNVSSNTYYQVLTSELINDTVTSTSNTQVATARVANTLNSTITAANTFLQAAVSSAGSYANSAFLHANGAFTAANNVAPQIEPAFSKANSGYARANTSLNTVSGTTGSATPSSGSMTFTSNNGLNVVGTSGSTLYFNTPQDLRSTGSPTFSSLLLSSPLAITQGGTGATSVSGSLTNLLPSASGVPAGYVLATGGVGTYYWAAGGTGGGGGAVPGTTINSTRLFPTVNTNQTVFTTPTYIVGANQLRVYIDGVRQMNSDYSELNSTSIQLGSSIPAGSVVMIEVDGYINNPYYANNISFTAPFGGIVTSANTIQLALQDVETRKATISSPTFTGLVKVPTPPSTTSNTVVASTAYVSNRLGDGGLYAHNISGYAARALTSDAVAASAITGQSGMYTSANRPGPYKLYRRDDDTNYSVQTYWTGERWRLYGYNGETAHADTHVGYADSVPWTGVTGRPTNISSFTNNSGYVTSSGSVNYATSAGSVPWTGVTGRPNGYRQVYSGTVSTGQYTTSHYWSVTFSGGVNAREFITPDSFIILTGVNGYFNYISNLNLYSFYGSYRLEKNISVALNSYMARLKVDFIFDGVVWNDEMNVTILAIDGSGVESLNFMG